MRSATTDSGSAEYYEYDVFGKPYGETVSDYAYTGKKKEAHWARDKNVRDILIHLYEWHQLILHWVSSNMKGEERPFLPEPYNWKTYGDMNVEFWKKHQNTPLKDADEMYRKSHEDVIKLAETFSDTELFTKDVFPWVGGSTLGSYFVSATASHLRLGDEKTESASKELWKQISVVDEK